MAQLDVRRLYASSAILTKQDIDAFIDDIETFLNLTKLNADNIQDASITVSSKVIDATITTAKVVNTAITTAKITDASITQAKIADDAVTTAKIADDAVTTAKLATASITTAKLADNAVTKAKLADVNSSSSGFFVDSNTSTSLTEVSSSGTTAITTTGRPVLIFLSVRPTSESYIKAVKSATTAESGRHIIAIKRDTTSNGSFSTLVASFRLEYNKGDGNATAILEIPPAAITQIDTPAAGTYYYKLYSSVELSSSTTTVSGQLQAVEL